MDGGTMQGHTDDAEAHRRCPPWCARDHRPGLHAEDQHHAGRSRRVAVVTGNPALDGEDLATAGAVLARLVRRTDSEVTWLEVVSEEGRDVRMVVTSESAQRLIGVLQEVVSEATR
jgi:hypothetical protein